MMASGRYLHRLAEHLAGRGIDSFVLDFRGHGGSVPPRAEHGWSFDDLVEQDLPAAMAAIREITGSENICYLGHSLGGLAGVAAMGTGAVPVAAKLVLVAVNSWNRPTPLRLAVGGAFLAATRLAGRLPVRALRLGTEDEARAYAEQFAGWILGGWRSQAGRSYWDEARHVRAPVFALVSSTDWMCRPADASELLGVLPGTARLRVVGRAQDDAADADHFGLLTDARLSPVWDEIADFVVAPAAVNFR
jgi:predicted alpha/beta hydrolase